MRLRGRGGERENRLGAVEKAVGGRCSALALVLLLPVTTCSPGFPAGGKAVQWSGGCNSVAGGRKAANAGALESGLEMQ